VYPFGDLKSVLGLLKRRNCFLDFLDCLLRKLF
jgi:hypothetical protein